MSNVSFEKKREFMKFILDNVLSREDEGYRVLYTFNKYGKFVERIHFVENAKKYPYGIEISATFSEGREFACYKPNDTLTEGLDTFMHFNSNRDPIYIQLNFKGKYSNELYMEVIEDDECSLETYLDGEDHDDIERLLKKQLIDFALDTRNEELFRKLIAN
ncbi:YpiB family protein [Bacillus cytotoxicus]|uniref:YpiB family protein n=1 Tax=Bacillus cytotoxicus TaxID=580165 RepID=UPI001AED94BD|nr:YpiB family protein [Bacillus cytotoxicus]QTR88972.1 YpiB family protein [Bacillus cytotoxicus]